MIYTGTLRHILKFYHVEKQITDSGYEEEVEVLYRTIRADRLKTKMTFGVDAEEEFHPNVLTFKLFYRAGTKLTDIVEYENKKYIIISLEEDKTIKETIIKIQLIND